jgi:ATP-binding cassette subfamily B multidrug efflux pump
MTGIQGDVTVTTTVDRRVLVRLLSYLLPHRRSLAVAFLLLFIATAADVASPILTKWFIDDYLAPRRFPTGPLVALGSGYLVLQVIATVFNFLQIYLFQKIALWVIQQLRIDVFGKVQHLGLAFFDRTPTGALISRITNDTEAIKDLFVSVLSTFVKNIVFLIGVFVSMFLLNVQLAALCLILVPIIAGVMVLYRKCTSRVFHLARSKLSHLNAKLNESLQGMYLIQAMRQEPRLRKEFATINLEHYKARLRMIQFNGLLLRPLVDLIYTLALMGVLLFFGVRSRSSGADIGVIYVFINYLGRFFEPINEMIARLNLFQQAVVSAERVFQLLDETTLAPRKEGSSNPKITEGLVRFENVSFSYDGHTPVLKNISFTALPGQTVAIVGHTGSGKSTIINLLLRFYPVDSGDIFIDGHSIREFTDEELRSKIGLVLQDPFVFVGDVKQNIRLGREGISDEEVVQAAQFVQAHPFIERLPRKYDEPLAERGATLSGGQRQLLSFARTMAGNPRILVLDEATANIDTETEEAIQTALAKMRKGRTTIAIAHRLSTIQDADLILVLHHGEIVERGTHQELLAKGGLYHKMYLLQQGAQTVDAHK